MRRYLLGAGIAAAALLPFLVSAQQTCEQQHQNRVVGAVAGAGIGALVGSAVTGGDGRVAGAIVGGVGGGIVGYQLTRPNEDCRHGYGYYDSDGRWYAGVVSGYFDGSGRWIAGPAIGRYDANGRWISGKANGHRDLNGVWVADPQAGYYDHSRWVAGPAMGYYDADGRWLTAAYDDDPHGAALVDEGRVNWAGAPMDIESREAWLDQRIRRGMSEGTLARDDAIRALRLLNSIRWQARGLRHDGGQLSPGEVATIQAKLDDLNGALPWTDRSDQQVY